MENLLCIAYWQYLHYNCFTVDLMFELLRNEIDPDELFDAFEEGKKPACYDDCFNIN